MAQIIIDIPDLKLPLIKAWVDSRVSNTTGWADSDYADYADTYITAKFRAVIRQFQQQQYLDDNFTFDDPFA